MGSDLSSAGRAAGVGLGLSGNSISIDRFTSTPQAIVLGSNVVVAHSLGAAPFDVYVLIRCNIAELGFSINDEVDLTSGMAGASEGWCWAADGNNITLTFGVSGIAVLRQNAPIGTATLITVANWSAIIKATQSL